MSKPRTDLTGPGICRNYQEFCPDRIAKSLCRRCYQKIYYAYDPKAYAGRQEKEYQKAQQTLTRLLNDCKRLRECGVLEPLEYVNMYSIFDRKLQELRSRDNEAVEQIVGEADTGKAMLGKNQWNKWQEFGAKIGG